MGSGVVGFNVEPHRFTKADIAKIINQVAHVEKLLRLHTWEFICQSFEDTIVMAGENDFIYCDPPYIRRHVDYYDSWDEKSELALRKALIESKAEFMLSTWDHSDYRENVYIQSVWHGCKKMTREHFYHAGAKETNRNPVIEALLTNYTVTGQRNKLLSENGSVIKELRWGDMS